MQNISKIFIIFITTLFLTACLSTIPLSPQHKQNIHKVTVHNNVKVPEMTYVGPGIGYIGVLSAPASIYSSQQLKNTINRNKIKINDIVRDQFIASLKQNTRWEILDKNSSDKNQGDAHLEIEILSYGFIVPHGFSFEVSPIVTVAAKLVRNNGTLWQNHNSRLVYSYMGKSYKPKDFIDNPALISAGWQLAAEKAVHDIVKDLA